MFLAMLPTILTDAMCTGSFRVLVLGFRVHIGFELKAYRVNEGYRICSPNITGTYITHLLKCNHIGRLKGLTNGTCKYIYKWVENPVNLQVGVLPRRQGEAGCKLFGFRV